MIVNIRFYHFTLQGSTMKTRTKTKTKALTDRQKKLVESHLYLLKTIKRRLSKRYYWLSNDIIHTYSMYGLVNCAIKFDEDCGVPFKKYAVMKGWYLATDELRRDEILYRKGKYNPNEHTYSLNTFGGNQVGYSGYSEYGKFDEFDKIDNREYIDFILSKLSYNKRLLVEMVYIDGLSQGEAGRMFGITGQAVGLRLKGIMKDIKRIIRAMK